jgi:hypothetical protein
MTRDHRKHGETYTDPERFGAPDVADLPEVVEFTGCKITPPPRWGAPRNHAEEIAALDEWFRGAAAYADMKEPKE